MLLWRILQVHIIQIGAHVYWHKDQNRCSAARVAPKIGSRKPKTARNGWKSLQGDALKDNAKALHLLSQLENQFPQYFKPNYKAHCPLVA